MASVKLGNKAVGSVVKFKVDGVLTEFLVVHQGKPGSMYDDSCDGTWLLMKDIYTKSYWDNDGKGYNDYANSAVHQYVNDSFLKLVDAGIREKIKPAKIPYRPGFGNSMTVNSGANGLLSRCFLLSATEVGTTDTYAPEEGVKLSYFTQAAATRIAYFTSEAEQWFTRTPNCWEDNGSGLHNRYIKYIEKNGYLAYDGSGTAYKNKGIRPAMVLPPDTLWVNDAGEITENTAPGAPSSITIPEPVMGGTSITVSWGASSDAEGNLEGYAVERSTDGGSVWTQIYQGSDRRASNSVPFGTVSVLYRVRAYDSEGMFSPWRTSAQAAVVNNSAPGASGGIAVPEEIKGGGTAAITWSAAVDPDEDLAGYELERQVDGREWTVIYTGTETSYTDTVTKGWNFVSYRVRAYDSYGVYGPYVASSAREVDNNTAPAIVCALSGDLGPKAEGFTVDYTVSDEDEGDSLTVKETLDGKERRSFQAASGQAASLALTGLDFMRLLNGKHTIDLSVSDGRAETVHSLRFTKAVTAASVTLKEPMPADDRITLCVLSVAGSIPEDAKLRVEVTNNGLDENPVWVDCTAAVRAGANILLENETAENGFAFNFRLNVERGPSGKGGSITSVQGGFQ